MLFHYFDRFLVEYEDRFEKEYGFLRPIIKEVAERPPPPHIAYQDFLIGDVRWGRLVRGIGVLSSIIGTYQVRGKKGEKKGKCN